MTEIAIKVSEHLIYSMVSIDKQKLNVHCLHWNEVHFKYFKNKWQGLRNLLIVLC